jgi:hypothetical protein
VLQPLGLEGVRLARDLALVYRKDRQLSKAAQEFLEIATQPVRKRDSDAARGRARGTV